MLLLIWAPEQRTSALMQQYGASLASTIAHSTSGLLLNQNQIELAVIAADIASFDEVSGITFYDPTQNILAMAGNQSMQHDFTAHASMNDTITGYVAITLEPSAFAAPPRYFAWAGTLLVLLSAPLLAIGVVQLSQRGNRSLPIVSVNKPPADEAQESFCITVNLHNALALGKQGSQAALEDALHMAQEVCALHAGFATIANSRGVLLLFDRSAVSASQAICAGFLLLELLADYETEGEFRCYLHTCECPRSPAELTTLDMAMLGGDFDFEHALTMAALSRPLTLLHSDPVYKALEPTEADWSAPFNHPMLEDGEVLFVVRELPQPQNERVHGQKTVILGFSA
ncbi:MAG: hypothetical protein RJQ07_14845 [Pseudomonadales bacterium]